SPPAAQRAGAGGARPVRRRALPAHRAGPRHQRARLRRRQPAAGGVRRGPHGPPPRRRRQAPGRPGRQRRRQAGGADRGAPGVRPARRVLRGDAGRRPADRPLPRRPRRPQPLRRRLRHRPGVDGGGGRRRGGRRHRARRRPRLDLPVGGLMRTLVLGVDPDPELWVRVPSRYPDDDAATPEEWARTVAAERGADSAGLLERLLLDLALSEQRTADGTAYLYLPPDGAPMQKVRLRALPTAELGAALPGSPLDTAEDTVE